MLRNRFVYIFILFYIILFQTHRQNSEQISIAQLLALQAQREERQQQMQLQQMLQLKQSQNQNQTDSTYNYYQQLLTALHTSNQQTQQQLLIAAQNRIAELQQQTLSASLNFPQSKHPQLQRQQSSSASLLVDRQGVSELLNKQQQRIEHEEAERAGRIENYRVTSPQLGHSSTAEMSSMSQSQSNSSSKPSTSRQSIQHMKLGVSVSLDDTEKLNEHISRLISENEALLEPSPVLLKRRAYHRNQPQSAMNLHASKSTSHGVGEHVSEFLLSVESANRKLPKPLAGRSQSLLDSSMLAAHSLVSSHS